MTLSAQTWSSLPKTSCSARKKPVSLSELSQAITASGAPLVARSRAGPRDVPHDVVIQE